MLSIGLGETILLLTLAIVVLGPEKIPALARTIAQIFHRLKSIQSDIHKDFSQPLKKEIRSLSTSKNKERE